MAKKGRKGKKGSGGGAQPAHAREHEPPAASAPLAKPEQTDPAAHAQRAAAIEPHAAEAAHGKSRMLGNALIVIFLAYQVAMPLRYYLQGGGYDERFSWRMFSTLRMQKCKAKVEELVGEDLTPRTVDLNQELQIAWIGMLERYRRPVVDKLLFRRCALPDVREVEYVRTCTDTDGQLLPQTRVELDCKSRVFEASEPKPDDDRNEGRP